MSSEKPVVPLACDLDAIPAGERNTHQTTSGSLFAAVLEVQELPDGYAFRLPAEAAMVRQVAAYIANERLCCPFFRFELTVDSGEGPLWLRLTGGAGVKEFLAAELGK